MSKSMFRSFPLFMCSPRLLFKWVYISLALGPLSLWYQSCHCLTAVLTLSGSGVCCQITPDGHTEEAPLEKKFSAHASRCCSQGKREEAVQDPCAMLHWVVASKKLEPSETCIPALDPVSGELASGHMGPKPQVGQASACPISGPVHAGQS